LVAHLRPGDIRLLNKADLGAFHVKPVEGVADIALSAASGEGFPEFERALGDAVQRRLVPRETPSLTRTRHRVAENRAAQALRRAEVMLARSADLAGEDVRLAARALEELTGRVGVEDVLDRVFSQFCIGK